MISLKENRHFRLAVYIGGGLIVALALGCGVFVGSKLYRSFVNLNREFLINQAAIRDLQLKTGTPAPTYVPPAPEQQDQTKSYVDGYIVRENILGLLNDRYFGEKVHRGGQSTTFEFPDGDNPTFDSFHIRNSVFDRYPIRTINWLEYESQGYALKLLTTDIPWYFVATGEKLFVSLTINIQHQWGSGGDMEGSDTCKDMDPAVTHAASLISEAMRDEYISHGILLDDICKGIRVTTASGQPIEASTMATGTGQIYQFVYMTKQPIRDDQRDFDPPVSYVVLQANPPYHHTMIRIRANGTRAREGMLGKEDYQQAERDISLILDDMLQSMHPEQCDFGYGTCY